MPVKRKGRDEDEDRSSDVLSARRDKETADEKKRRLVGDREQAFVEGRHCYRFSAYIRNEAPKKLSSASLILI